MRILILNVKTGQRVRMHTDYTALMYGRMARALTRRWRAPMSIDAQISGTGRKNARTPSGLNQDLLIRSIRC